MDLHKIKIKKVCLYFFRPSCHYLCSNQKLRHTLGLHSCESSECNDSSLCLSLLL